MTEFLSLIGLSGAAAEAASWLLVGRGALWLWLHFERARTIVVEERLARAAVHARAPSSLQ